MLCLCVEKEYPSNTSRIQVLYHHLHSVETVEGVVLSGRGKKEGRDVGRREGRTEGRK